MWLNTGVCHSAGEKNASLALSGRNKWPSGSRGGRRRALVCSSLPENRVQVKKGREKPLDGCLMTVRVMNQPGWSLVVKPTCRKPNTKARNGHTAHTELDGTAKLVMAQTLGLPQPTQVPPRVPMGFDNSCCSSLCPRRSSEKQAFSPAHALTPNHLPLCEWCHPQPEVLLVPLLGSSQFYRCLEMSTLKC